MVDLLLSVISSLEGSTLVLKEDPKVDSEKLSSELDSSHMGRPSISFFLIFSSFSVQNKRETYKYGTRPFSPPKIRQTL